MSRFNPEDGQDDVTYLVNAAREAFGHLVQGISVFDNNLNLVSYNDRFCITLPIMGANE